AKVIGVPESFLEKETGFFQITGPRQALHIPKRTHGKRAFLPQKPIIESITRLIAIHQRVAHKRFLESPQCREPTWVNRADKAHQRHEQGGGIQRLSAFVLHKGLPLLIPEVGKDVMIDLVAGATPLLQGGWERALICQAEATIECDPAHDSGIEKF